MALPFSFYASIRHAQTPPRGIGRGREFSFSKRRRTLYGRAENGNKKAKKEIFSIEC